MPSFGLVHALSRRWVAIALVLALGVSLSVGAFFVLRAQERRSIENDVREEAKLRAEAVADELDDALAAVRAIRGLHGSSDNVSREEFDATAGKLLESSAALEGMEWAPFVPDARRDAYERLAGPEGAPGFRFTELGRSGRLERAERREAYYPVYFAVPAAAKGLLGYDLGSDAQRLSLLADARDSGREVAGPGLRLPETKKRRFVLLAPVYHPGAATKTLRQRREAIAGFAVAILSPASLLDHAVGASQPGGIETMLVDRTEPAERLLAFRDSAGGRPAASLAAAEQRMARAGARYRNEFPFGLGGRSWALVVAPSPEFTAAASTWLPWGGLVLGLAVTTLLALRLARGSLHTARIERLVEDRTMKLSKANASLRETGDRLKALVEASPLATISLDLEGNVTSWSQAAERLFGWRAGEVIGHTPPNVAEDRRTEFDECRRRSLEGNEVLHLETQRLRRDGSVVDVVIYVAPLHDELGRPGGNMTVIADITERKQVEEALRESEERFRTAFDEAAVGMAITGLDGNFRRVNRALCDIIGYSADELLQMRFHDITHLDDREDNVAALQEFVEGDARVLKLEKRYVHSNGDEVWVLLNIALVRDAAGTPLYYVTEIQDITDWKRAVQALRESEERFRLMADSAPALAWMSEADGRPAFYNRGWLDFTGRTLEEELAQPSRAIHPDDIAATTASFAEAIAARTSWEAEYRLRRHDGAYRWISDWAVPRFLPDGSYAGLTGVAVDVTDRKQAEEERERLLAYEREQVERLRELDGLKDDLVATVSHELRTPLTNILGYVNVAVGVISEGEGRRLLSVIERNAKRLLNLVNDLLVVAQVDSGKLTIQNEPVDLPALVRESVENARAAAQLKGLTLRLEAEPVAGFRGDHPRLVQLVDNLLGNAIKFTASGGHVTVRVGANAGTAFVEVEDSGIGIAEKDLDRLFERFYRAAEARQEAVQGTGLGLTIVRAIAESHGGTVTVRSAPREGATFRVELPVQASARAAA